MAFNVSKLVSAPGAQPRQEPHAGTRGDVARKVSNIIQAGPEAFRTQRVLTADDSVTYVVDARNVVRGAYRQVATSRDGTAWATDGRYWAIVPRDGAGETVVDLGEGAVPELFWDGMAKFRHEGRTGFVNQHGDVVAEARFDDARDFDGLYALAKWGGRWGAIDRSGGTALAPAYLDEDAAAVAVDKTLRKNKAVNVVPSKGPSGARGADVVLRAGAEAFQRPQADVLRSEAA